MMAESGDEFTLAMLNRSLGEDYVFQRYYRLFSTLPSDEILRHWDEFTIYDSPPENNNSSVNQREMEEKMVKKNNNQIKISYQMLRKSYKFSYIQIPKTGSTGFYLGFLILILSNLM